MSVYSGFTTRQQETFYNKLLERMIQLFAVKLMQAMKRIDELTSGTGIVAAPPQKVNESTAQFGDTSTVVIRADESI